MRRWVHAWASQTVLWLVSSTKRWRSDWTCVVQPYEERGLDWMLLLVQLLERRSSSLWYRERSD